MNGTSYVVNILHWFAGVTYTTGINKMIKQCHCSIDFCGMHWFFFTSFSPGFLFRVSRHFFPLVSIFVCYKTCPHTQAFSPNLFSSIKKQEIVEVMQYSHSRSMHGSKQRKSKTTTWNKCEKPILVRSLGQRKWAKCLKSLICFNM